MADLARRTLAAELAVADPALAAPGFVVRMLDPARLCLVTGGPELVPNTVLAGDPGWLWLAPGRSLALCMTSAADVEGGFVTDVTDGLAMLALSGEHVADVVAMGCTLDAVTLGARCCAQTLFAGVRVLLWRDGAGLNLCADRSLAAFLLAWMRQAASALPTPPD